MRAPCKRSAERCHLISSITVVHLAGPIINATQDQMLSSLQSSSYSKAEPSGSSLKRKASTDICSQESNLKFQRIDEAQLPWPCEMADVLTNTPLDDLLSELTELNPSVTEEPESINSSPSAIWESQFNITPLSQQQPVWLTELEFQQVLDLSLMTQQDQLLTSQRHSFLGDFNTDHELTREHTIESSDSPDLDPQAILDDLIEGLDRNPLGEDLGSQVLLDDWLFDIGTIEGIEPLLTADLASTSDRRQEQVAPIGEPYIANQEDLGVASLPIVRLIEISSASIDLNESASLDEIRQFLIQRVSEICKSYDSACVSAIRECAEQCSRIYQALDSADCQYLGTVRYDATIDTISTLRDVRSVGMVPGPRRRHLSKLPQLILFTDQTYEIISSNQTGPRESLERLHRTARRFRRLVSNHVKKNGRIESSFTSKDVILKLCDVLRFAEPRFLSVSSKYISSRTYLAALRNCECLYPREIRDYTDEENSRYLESLACFLNATRFVKASCRTEQAKGLRQKHTKLIEVLTKSVLESLNIDSLNRLQEILRNARPNSAIRILFLWTWYRASNLADRFWTEESNSTIVKVLLTWPINLPVRKLIGKPDVPAIIVYCDFSLEALDDDEECYKECEQIIKSHLERYPALTRRVCCGQETRGAQSETKHPLIIRFDSGFCLLRRHLRGDPIGGPIALARGLRFKLATCQLLSPGGGGAGEISPNCLSRALFHALIDLCWKCEGAHSLALIELGAKNEYFSILRQHRHCFDRCPYWQECMISESPMELCHPSRLLANIAILAIELELSFSHLDLDPHQFLARAHHRFLQELWTAAFQFCKLKSRQDLDSLVLQLADPFDINFDREQVEYKLSEAWAKYGGTSAEQTPDPQAEHQLAGSSS